MTNPCNSPLVHCERRSRPGDPLHIGAPPTKLVAINVQEGLFASSGTGQRPRGLPIILLLFAGVSLGCWLTGTGERLRRYQAIQCFDNVSADVEGVDL